MEIEVFNIMFIVALCLTEAFVHSEENPNFIFHSNFEPECYQLTITTYLDSRLNFEGSVLIKLKCTKSTDTIVLNSVDLDINTECLTITDKNNKPVRVDDVTCVSEIEQVFIKSCQTFQPGEEYVLFMSFNGTLICNDATGYYSSSYEDVATNSKKLLAITQFDPIYARRGFPCIDNPSSKAKFKIILIHHKKFIAVSNMPLLRSNAMTSNPDYVLTEFEESPVMSTYLVSYMVLEMTYEEWDCCNSLVKFRIFARNYVICQMDFAKDVVSKAIEYYQKYFNNNYSLPKLDVIVIPYLDSGFTISWGVIAFSEELLLIDPNETSDREYVSTEICLNLVYQWLGNLVSLKLLSNIWFYNGIVMRIGGQTRDILYPESNFYQYAITKNIMEIFDIDSVESSLPMSATNPDKDNVVHCFYYYPSLKAEIILRMMVMFLCEETFNRGVQSYIATYEFSNADHNNFWKCMTNQAHQDGSLDKSITVNEIMDMWTNQAGYPVLKIEREYSTGKVIVSQERFLSVKSKSTDCKNCWWIPLSWTSSTELNFCNTKVKTWLNCKNNHYTLDSIYKDDWIIFNLQFSALCRVAYDQQNWMAIAKTLNNPNEYTIIHIMNRIQLVNDLLSFSEIGYMDYCVTFMMLNYLSYEQEYLPWNCALSKLKNIASLMRRTKNEIVFKKFMLCILSPLYKKYQDMTIELKNDEKMKLKNLIIYESCLNGNEDCINQSKILFTEWRHMPDPDKNNSFSKIMIHTIIPTAIKFGNYDDWYFLLEYYKKCNDDTQKSYLLEALACSSDPLLLKKLLDWSIENNSIISNPDAVFFAMSSSFNSDIGFCLAKDFLYSKITEISSNKLAGPYLIDFIGYIGNQLKTKEELEEFQQFINKSLTCLNNDATSQIIDTIHLNIKWTSMYSSNIDSYMICN